MPRLTKADYLHAHHALQQLWLEDERPYGFLAPDDQQYLHDYFQASHQLTEAELLTHRQAITAARPQLPQQAGRALAKLLAATQQVVRQPAGTTISRGKTQRTIQVHSVVNPTIDAQVLANILLDIATQRDQPGSANLTDEAGLHRQ